MTWEFKDNRPIYTQLVEQITLKIVSGEYKIGEKLPSVRDLASEATVNPNTMQKALAELESEGLLFTERTNGKFVTSDVELIEKVKRNLAKEKVKSYLDGMKDIGIEKSEAIKYLQELGGEK